MKKVCISLIFLLFLIVSCGETTGDKPVNKGVAGFQVEFAEDFDLGGPDPKERRNDGPVIETTIKVTALGYDKKPLTTYNGEVEIDMLYGEVSAVSYNEKQGKYERTSRILLTNGYSENVKVEMEQCLDSDRIVVEEVVPEHEGDDNAEKTGKMGVSPVFYTNVATISTIQGTVKDSGDSFYHGRNLTLKDKTMVVIAVIEGGFYLHEVSEKEDENEEGKEYSSIYMYTYSTPYVDDNVEETVQLQPGTLIESANGSVYEFSGFTEMSFPTFHPVYEKKNGKKELKINTKLIPEPKPINDILKDDSEMEKYEASLVRVEKVFVDWFDENESSFVEYSQFRLKTFVGKKTILAQTLYTAPLFNAVKERLETPNAEPKQCYTFTGILKQHSGAQPTSWIIVPYDPFDSDNNGIKPVDCNK